MDAFNRRRLLAAAGGTLASTILPRKPQAQTILTPKEPVIHLTAFDALTLTAPPTPPAAQDFTDAEGHRTTLSDFAGKALLINLWATWCTPCVAEMPALDEAASQLAADNIQILPLSSDRGGTPTVQRFYTAHAITHLGIWLDPRGIAARAWNARGLPTTILVNRQGQEVARLEGATNWATPIALTKIRDLLGVG